MSEKNGRPLFPEDFGYLGTGTNREGVNRKPSLPAEAADELLSQTEKQIGQAKELLRQKLRKELELLRRTEKVLPAPSGIFRGEPEEEALPIICRMLISWEELQKESFPVFFALHAAEKQLAQLRADGIVARCESDRSSSEKQGDAGAGGTEPDSEAPDAEAQSGNPTQGRLTALSGTYAHVFSIAQEDAGTLSTYLRQKVGEAADLSGNGKQCRLQTVFSRCGEVRDRLERLLLELQDF